MSSKKSQFSRIPGPPSEFSSKGRKDAMQAALDDNASRSGQQITKEFGSLPKPKQPARKP